jgi:hypothetical protein
LGFRSGENEKETEITHTLIIRCVRQPVHLVGHGHGARPQHLLVELLLLQLLQLLVELVFVEGLADGALGEGFADFFADGVLVAEVFPTNGRTRVRRGFVWWCARSRGGRLGYER